MEENTYDVECMRAELLGIEKPNYEEFMEKKKERDEASREALMVEEIKESELNKEQFRSVGGKLNELNEILTSTQRKLNNMTMFSIPSFIKKKLGLNSSEQSPKEDTNQSLDNPRSDEEKPIERTCLPVKNEEKEDLDQGPVLDDILDKFERAEAKTKYQRNQMKKLMK